MRNENYIIKKRGIIELLNALGRKMKNIHRKLIKKD